MSLSRLGSPAMNLLSAQRPIERACYVVGAVLIASGLLHLGMFALDPRPWLGPLSWRKPVTFGLSFGLTLISITWIASYLGLTDQARNWLLGLFAADCVVEVSGITLQAWRHVPSHFNTSTPTNSVVAFSLAAGGALLILTLGLLGVTAFRRRIDGPPSMELALRAGFALLIAGLGSGVAMIVRGTTLTRSGHVTAAYDTGGYLKLFHAVTLHAVLVLPLLAWWLSRTDATESRRTTIVAVATTGYVVAAAGALAVSLLTS
ncbi:MAG: hypothetical protein QOE71_992 [Pseudonocardiales bacterium]|nr:hypothetical protein [Pseudonocardiales bacterium]